jgi:hypothetical protein
MKLNLRIIFFTCMLFLPIALVFAQAKTDWSLQLVKVIFGDLPSPCVRGVSAPNCVDCIAYAKVIPFIFFVAIFFLMFYYIIAHMGTTQQAPPGTPMLPVVAGPRQLSVFESKVVAILSVVLAIILLHSIGTKTILSTLTFFVNFLIFIFVLFMLRSIFKMTSGMVVILEIIIAVVVMAAIWNYVGGMVNPLVQGWQTMCIR